MTGRADPPAMTLDQALQQAVAHHQAGRLSAAEALYRSILQAMPGQPDANHNLGLIAVQVGQPASGLPFLETALRADERRRQFWFSYAEALSLAGREADALALLDMAAGKGHGGSELDVLRARLDSAAHGQMAEIVALFEQGLFPAGEAAARQFLRDRPGAVFGWKSLGLFLQSQGHAAAALDALRTTIALEPNDAEACVNYGNASRDMCRYESAVTAYRRALVLRVEFPLAELNLASACRDLGQLPQAKVHGMRAIQADPANPEAYNTLGVILRDMEQWVAAIANYRTALCLRPDLEKVHFNLAVALQDQGRFSESEARYRRALVLRPTYLEAQGNLLFVMNCMVERGPDMRLEEARRYGRLAAAGVMRNRRPHWICKPDPVKLRVGIVSGDLWRHAVGFFLESLLASIDPDRLELVAYQASTTFDDVSARLRPHFAGWRSIAGVDDETAARLIAADGIHVLIDLSGHTNHNRMPLFAWRPAPVQATWLGYCATTGVAEIDYFLGDPHLTPPADEAQYTERVWRLSESFLCFAPPEFPVEVGPLPAETTGCVTFGSFNNLIKVNEAVVALWARVLLAVPGSRLLLKTGKLRDAALREDMRQRFAACGIGPERLMLEGTASRAELLEAYRRVDIALDTFPYAGGTTSIEALWMGVPFVTLLGVGALARMGGSIARNAGLPDWVARDKNDYVALCAAWAGQPGRLASLRAGLRPQVLSSALFDGQRFARHFATALWGMWEARRPVTVDD